MMVGVAPAASWLALSLWLTAAWPLCTVRAVTFNDECAYKQIDLAFIVDRSGSIAPQDWEKAQSFVQKVTEDFTVGQDDTR